MSIDSARRKMDMTKQTNAQSLGISKADEQDKLSSCEGNLWVLSEEYQA